MAGLWERLAGGDRARMESSDCESLGSASGSEGGERREPSGAGAEAAGGGPEALGPAEGTGPEGVAEGGGEEGSSTLPLSPTLRREPLWLPGADPLSSTEPDSADQASLPDLDLLLHDPEDEVLCAELLELVQATLGKAPLGARRCSRLLMPAQLVAQVRTELLRLACSEPCGLRGALLDLCVEHGKACHDVGHIAVDPAVVPTFQLTLVLRLDSRLWPKIQGLFASGPAFTPGFGQALKLSTGFRVIKKKLYSSEQLLIEEC